MLRVLLIALFFSTAFGCSTKNDKQASQKKNEIASPTEPAYSIVLLKDTQNATEKFFVWKNVFGRRSLDVYMQNGSFFGSLKEASDFLESNKATVIIDESSGLKNQTYTASRLDDAQIKFLKEKKLISE